MGCGFHQCERLCHNDECGNCSAPCGKARKSWYVVSDKKKYKKKSCILKTFFFVNDFSSPDIHPCARTISSQRTTGSGSSGHHHHAATPKCNNDCQTAKRNARLADALGISQEGRDSKSVMYNDELVGFARGNTKFLGLVERTFAE